jgi:transcriptional regulator with XRE-family HTH domain
MGKRLTINRLKVREVCEARGWSSDELARYAWIGYQTARNLYYGKTTDPTITNMISVARALGVYVEDLIDSPDLKAHSWPPREPVPQEGELLIKKLRVKELCEARGWGYDLLARVSGVKFPTVSSILSGRTVDGAIGTLVPIAQALDVSVEELIGESEIKKILPLGSAPIAI